MKNKNSENVINFTNSTYSFVFGFRSFVFSPQFIVFFNELIWHILESWNFAKVITK